MIKKTIRPIVSTNVDSQLKQVVGMDIEIKFLHILIYKKVTYLPSRYDVRVLGSDAVKYLVEQIIHS